MKTLRLRLFLLLAAIALLSRAAIADTIVVNSTADPAGFNNNITIPQLGSTITLRDAIAAVRNTGGTHTITFAPSLAGQTIYLTHQTPDTNDAFFPYQVGQTAVNLTIQGLTGNSGITIARSSNAPAMGLFLCLGSGLSLTVNDLTFSGGDKLGLQGWGGAFNILGSHVTMNRCTLTGNRAALGGAIHLRDAGTLSLSNCTIAGNTAGDEGGGIFNYTGAPVTLTHTTITNNSAPRGGGLFTYYGGDLLVNTIIAGNHAYFGFGYDLDGNNGSGTSVSSASHHNLIGDAASSGGLSHGVNGNIVGANAHLNVLAFNGGPTPTAALSADSPARNAAASGVVNIDQRAISRPQGAGADIGAYELVDGAPTAFASADKVTFVIDLNNSFNVIANGLPAPTYSLSGTLPSGLTFSSTGVLSGTPAAGTEGTYPLSRHSEQQRWICHAILHAHGDSRGDRDYGRRRRQR
jgi:hypothetical protein